MAGVLALPSGGVRLTLDGLTIELDSSVVKKVASLAQPAAQSTVQSEIALLPEEHPMWDHHSGGSRHEGQPWSLPGDVDSARELREHLEGKACGAFFDFILEEPGRLFTSEEIVKAHPEFFSSAKAVAGSLAGFVKPTEELHRPFPFHWWEGVDGKPTRYAIRPSTAAVFVAAGK